MRCVPLSGVARHAFTTRELVLPGAGAPDGQGWLDLAGLFEVAPARLAQLNQVHGAQVVRIPTDAAGARGNGTWADGDALITSQEDVALAVKTADCVPILIADRITGAVAAVHAGWRGTAAAVVQATVHAMERSFGTRPADLLAAIGPSIGPCCCEVGTDVCDAFLEAGARPDELAEWFTVVPKPAQHEGLGLGHAARSAGRAGRAGKLWLDPWLANADQLVAVGVPRPQVWLSGLCTACYPELLHSYRADGARSGRMAAVVRAGG